MKFVFSLVICLLFSVSVSAQEISMVDKNEAAVDQISRLIKFQMRFSPKNKLVRNDEYRRGMASDIVDVATEAGIPLQLFTMLLYQESTFRTTVVGLKEEKGIGQVMNPKRYACDMSTRVGQMQCSADYLVRGYDKCGSWTGALSYYQSSKGACKPVPGSVHERKVRYRVQRWVVLRKRFPIDKNK